MTNEITDEMIAVDPILGFFSFRHLPAELREVSMPFNLLAAQIFELTPRSAERTTCFRKLLEAKDCAVRAAL